ncbi:MAG: hypothetical protein JWN00_4462, partial [Actinomycetia bacterium]|nr:hypothetical protein [Actinomycetes bacterium]
DWPYGPYTIDDLDSLPDDGERRELVNGWIVVAPWPSTYHDHAPKILERALEPEPCIQVRLLGSDGRYHVAATVQAGTELKTDVPFRFSLDPAELVQP